MCVKRILCVYLFLVIHCTLASGKFQNGGRSDGSWQPVVGNKSDFLVYSAFMDNRFPEQPVIRVVAVVARSALNVLCRVTLVDGCYVTLRARVQKLQANSKFKYSPAFILCPLHIMNPYDAVNGTVTIMPRNKLSRMKKYSRNQLRIMGIEPNRRHKNIIQVCVAPASSRISSDRLLEWLEMNSRIGVTKFYWYSLETVPTSVKCLLKEYLSTGKVELMGWYPNANKTNLERSVLHGALLQDCLYRSMSSGEYLVTLTLGSDFVVPQYHHTLKQLFAALRLNNGGAIRASGFMFRKVFFYTFWPDDKGSQFNLMTSNKTLRTDPPMSNANQSKCIVRPYKVTELDSNCVKQFLRYWDFVFEVPTDVGLMHQYNDKCEYGTALEVCKSIKNKVDRSATKWSDGVMKRVKKMKDIAFGRNKCHK